MLPRAAWLTFLCALGCAAAQPQPLGSAAPLETAVEPGDAGFSEGGGPTSSDLASAETADGAANEWLDLPVADEAPYTPGARRRPKGAMAASNDDDAVARWNRGGPGAGAGATPDAKPPHPAPRVKVDVVKVQGKIEEADVLRTARAKGYWPFRLCYEDGLRRAPKLHGTVRFRITLGPNGSPRGIRKISAEVDDPVVVSCVLKAARNLTLASPERGTPDVTLDVSFWPGDSPVGSPTAATRTTATLENAEALVESLRARWPEVRACFAAGLRRQPGLWGRLAMKLRVTATGRITEAAEVESRFPDRDVTECTLRAYERAGLGAQSEERVIVYALRLGRPPE